MSSSLQHNARPDSPSYESECMKKCQICGDEARKYNYGVHTCNGCASFFDREKTKQVQPVCRFGGCCEITSKTRHFCKPCRYNKCLEAGMVVRAVHKPKFPPRIPSKKYNQSEPKTIEMSNILQQYSDSVSMEKDGLQEVQMEQSTVLYKQKFPQNTASSGMATVRSPNGSFSRPTVPQGQSDMATVPQICQVCGDETMETVLLSGVPTCNICQKFFPTWYSMASSSMHKCKFDGGCATTAFLWRYCQSCEFNKCLGVGMKKDAIQKSRRVSPSVAPPSRGTKRRADAPTADHGMQYGKHPNNPDQGQRAPDGVVMDYQNHPSYEEGPIPQQDSIAEEGCAVMYHHNTPFDQEAPIQDYGTVLQQLPVTMKPTTTELIYRAHKKYCSHTVAKFNKITPKPYRLIDFSGDPFVNCLNAWQAFSHEVAQDIKEMAEFVERIPRIKELDVHDGRLLIMKNYFPALLLRWSRGFSEQGLVLPDGRVIDLPTLDVLYGPQLVEQILNFARKAQAFSDASIANFIVLMLLKPVHEAELRNHQKFREVRRFYTLVVKDTLDLGQYENSVIPMITEMSSMNEAHHQLLNFLRDNDESIVLAKVFKEFFEINSLNPGVDAIVQPNLAIEKSMMNQKPLGNTSNGPPCSVCGEESVKLGEHYGVWTCNSCMQFFSKNVGSKSVSSCKFFSGMCEITPKTRYDCKGCRMKKCLAVGMKKDIRDPRKAMKPTSSANSQPCYPSYKAVPNHNQSASKSTRRRVPQPLH